MKTCKSIFLSVCLLLTSFPAHLVQAGTFVATDDHTSALSVPLKGDLYIAGGKVVLENPVQGDVVTAGGSIIINTDVKQDLLAAGGSLIVNGRVEDDVRAAAGDITMFSSVGGDLIVFGGRVHITGNAVVEGDLVAAGGNIVLDGTVKGDVRVGGGEVLFNGTVLGNSVFKAGEKLDLNGTIQGNTTFSSEDVSIGPAASFGGDVEYWTQNGSLDFPPGVVAGEVLFNPDLKPEIRLPPDLKIRKWHAARFLGVWFFFGLLTGALSIFVFSFLPKRWYTLAVGSLRDGFWGNLGVGFLYFVLTPIIAFIFMATVIGIPLGLFILFLFLFSLVFSKVVSAIVLARWLERRRFGQWGKAALFFLSLLLFAALKCLTLIPVLGWLVVLVLVCAVYGSILNAAWAANRDTI